MRRERRDGLFVGLMSGTSVDAIDCVLVECKAGEVALLATHSEPLSNEAREKIAAISHPGANEIARMGSLDRELGERFAAGTLRLLDIAGVSPGQVTAIGSHGQTIRHHPPSDKDHAGLAFTLQVGDPNTIAEQTGITTVADFRRRDLAAGGEGAPLAPAFHGAVFGRNGRNRAIVNIGGIANISLLREQELLAGFDSGPGNTLMDLWIRKHRDEAFDRDGAWAASGTTHAPLLESLQAHPYFFQATPKSTGKECFNLDWLSSMLEAHPGLPPQDVQATLAELTATSIARAIEDFALAIDEVYVCGGGAHNRHLLARLSVGMGKIPVGPTTDLGISPDWVEAITFAWLAHRTLSGVCGNVPAVTGAKGERILGGIYPA